MSTRSTEQSKSKAGLATFGSSWPCRMKLCVFLGECVSLPFATPACGRELAQDSMAATLAGSQHGHQIFLKRKAGLSLEEQQAPACFREVVSSPHQGINTGSVCLYVL